MSQLNLSALVHLLFVLVLPTLGICGLLLEDRLRGRDRPLDYPGVSTEERHSRLR